MAGEESEQGTQPLRRGIGDSMYTREAYATREAPCRANKGTPGVDRQDFTEVEAYGVERWLGELAQALKGSRKGSSTSSGTRSDGSIHRSGRPYLGAKPSRKSVKHVVEKIHALTARTGTGQETTEVVESLHHHAVAPVVVQETQSTQEWVARISPRVSLPDPRSGLPTEVEAQRAVGEGVRSCPRARCRRSARRVR
jgi:hypothetical protein